MRITSQLASVLFCMAALYFQIGYTDDDDSDESEEGKTLIITYNHGNFAIT